MAAFKTKASRISRTFRKQKSPGVKIPGDFFCESASYFPLVEVPESLDEPEPLVPDVPPELVPELLPEVEPPGVVELPWLVLRLFKLLVSVAVVEPLP